MSEKIRRNDVVEVDRKTMTHLLATKALFDVSVELLASTEPDSQIIARLRSNAKTMEELNV